jgi:hypothetical protein
MITINKERAVNKNINLRGILLLVTLLLSILWINTQAEEEKTANIKLIFEQTDSTYSCKAVVTSENAPVKEKEVSFYVKRMYSLLPIQTGVETDENGEAVANFPLDLPGDNNGNIVVVAKIEDDDDFGTVESGAAVKWGIIPHNEHDSWGSRSLSASRDKAPTILIIVSNSIIALIWGTLLYVFYQVIRIRKASKMLETKKE